MKTKLSDLFFSTQMVDKMKVFLEAFALKPMPDNDFKEFVEEFSSLKNESGRPFSGSIIIDRQLMDIILRSSKKYANFCFVERNGNISLALHLSNDVTAVDYNDSAYYLKDSGNQVDGMTVFILEEFPTLMDFLKDRNNYKEGLGDYINQITKRVNTEIVSYEKEDLALFNYNMLLTYGGRWEDFKYVKISFIIFKRMIGSGLDFEYKKRLGRISFAMQYCFEDQNKTVKTMSLSSPSDITSLWP